jgi:hypothetical protein
MMNEEENWNNDFNMKPMTRLKLSEECAQALLKKGSPPRILKERRQELRRSARIIAWATVVTAAATFAAALAAWTAIFFQYGHTAPNESHQSAASIAPTPSRLSTR